MKYLISILLLVFTFNVNAQMIEIGGDCTPAIDSIWVNPLGGINFTDGETGLVSNIPCSAIQACQSLTSAFIQNVPFAGDSIAIQLTYIDELGQINVDTAYAPIPEPIVVTSIDNSVTVASTPEGYDLSVPLPSQSTSTANDVGFGTQEIGDHTSNNTTTTYQETVTGFIADATNPNQQIFIAEDGTQYCVPVCWEYTASATAEANHVMTCNWQRFDLGASDQLCLNPDGSFSGYYEFVDSTLTGGGGIQFTLEAGGDVLITPSNCDSSVIASITYKIVCPDGSVSNEITETFTYEPVPVGVITIEKEMFVQSGNTNNGNGQGGNATTSEAGQSGDIVTISLTVCNTGTADVPNAVAFDELSNSLTYLSNDVGATFDAATNSLTWNIGTLQPGINNCVSMDIQAEITAQDGFEFIPNIGYASGDNGAGGITSDQDIDILDEYELPQALISADDTDPSNVLFTPLWTKEPSGEFVAGGAPAKITYLDVEGNVIAEITGLIGDPFSSWTESTSTNILNYIVGSAGSGIAYSLDLLGWAAENNYDDCDFSVCTTVGGNSNPICPVESTNTNNCDDFGFSCDIQYTLDGGVFTLESAGTLGDVYVCVENVNDPTRSFTYALGSLEQIGVFYQLGDEIILTNGNWKVTYGQTLGNKRCCTSLEVSYNLCETGLIANYNGPTSGVGSTVCYEVSIDNTSDVLFLGFYTDIVGDQISITYNNTEIFNSLVVVSGVTPLQYTIPFSYIQGVDIIEVCVNPDPNTTENNTLWGFTLGCCEPEAVCPIPDITPRVSSIQFEEINCAPRLNFVMDYPYFGQSMAEAVSGELQFLDGYDLQQNFRLETEDCFTTGLGGDGCIQGGYASAGLALPSGLACDRSFFGSQPCLDVNFTVVTNTNTGNFMEFSFGSTLDYNNFKTYWQSYQAQPTKDFAYASSVSVKEVTCNADGQVTFWVPTVKFQGNLIGSFDDVNEIFTYDITPYTPNSCCEESYLLSAGAFANTPSGTIYNSIQMATGLQSTGEPAGGGCADVEYRWEYTYASSCGEVTHDLVFFYNTCDMINTWELWYDDVTTGTLITTYDSYFPYGNNCNDTYYMVNSDGSTFTCVGNQVDITLYSFDLSAYTGGGSAETFTSYTQFRDRVRLLTGDNTLGTLPNSCFSLVSFATYNEVHTPIEITLL